MHIQITGCEKMKRFIILPLYYAIASMAIPLCAIHFTKAPAPPLPEETVSVFNHVSNESYSMNLEDYLIGVVAAEMPAAFENEALKAQAVAARTYTFYKAQSNSHKDDVCTDSAHCQAYLNEEQMRLNWGEDYDFYYDKIKNAVYSTCGEHLTYNKEPVMAVFHSMGGGKTENSLDVWGSDVPYLISVESPGEEIASNYETTQIVSFKEFKSIVTKNYPSAVINSFLDISQPTLTEGGHVKSIIVGSTVVSGTEMRKMFNLRSTKFTISFEGENIVFHVTGYGHGVGMSQYGANAMAKEGKRYTDILSHYYPGTTLCE